MIFKGNIICKEEFDKFFNEYIKFKNPVKRIIIQIYKKLYPIKNNTKRRILKGNG